MAAAKSSSRHEPEQPQAPRRKFARIAAPAAVWVTSGWNCSPNTGSVRWRAAASGQVSVRASGTNSAAPGSTWSPWLIHTSVRDGTPANRVSASSTSQVARPNSPVPPRVTRPPSVAQASCMP